MFFIQNDRSKKFLSLEQAVDAAHEYPEKTPIFIEEEGDGSKFWCVVAKSEGLIEVGRPMEPLRA